MTYLRAEGCFWELLSGWWRCQGRTLEDQIAAGVRWFDIRVAYCHDDGCGGHGWKFAHGAVTLAYPGYKGGQTAIDEVLGRIGAAGGCARLMLERGSEGAEMLFAITFTRERVTRRWPCVTGAVIKHGWQVVWDDRPGLRLTDLSYVPYHRGVPWWRQVRGLLGFPFGSIRGRAARSEHQPTDAELADERTVWVYDWVKNG